jgi:hypothetical protein
LRASTSKALIYGLQRRQVGLGASCLPSFRERGVSVFGMDGVQAVMPSVYAQARRRTRSH